MDEGRGLRSRIAAALRAEFDVLEGQNYESAYIYLQEAELDILLLGLPIETGGVKECLELLDRLDGSEIDTLVIVLSSDDKKSTALKIMDEGLITTTSRNRSIPMYCGTWSNGPSKSYVFSAKTASCARKSAARIPG